MKSFKVLKIESFFSGQDNNIYFRHSVYTLGNCYEEELLAFYESQIYFVIWLLTPTLKIHIVKFVDLRSTVLQNPF